MPRKECLCEVNQIRNDLVVCVSPKGSKFKAIAGLFLFCLPRVGILDGIEACAVGVVLGVCAIRDDKNLNILEQTRSCPEGISLVTVDLVKRLPDSNTPAFQLICTSGKPFTRIVTS